LFGKSGNFLYDQGLLNTFKSEIYDDTSNIIMIV